MIRFEGSGSLTFLSNITANAQHGDHTLTVSNGGNFTAGMVVVLEMTDTEHFGPLWQNNHNNQISDWDDKSCTWAKGGGSWTFWVESVSGNTVTLREPLPLDVDADVLTGWDPKLKAIEVLTEVGVENIRMEFFDPGVLQPHLEEVGYNGVGFSLVINSWAHNLEFHDADNGVTAGDNSAWVTVSDVSFSGRQGHHGISINGATHCLVKDIYFESDDRLPQTGGTDGVDDSWHHAVTYTHKAALNVSMNISSGGTNPGALYLDYHRNGPMENLFTQVNSPWTHGSAGDKCAGPSAAARNTFWNLHGQAGEVEGAPGLNWGHIQTNVVTVLSVGEKLTTDRRWYEDVANLQPTNIYLAQLNKRQNPTVVDLTSFEAKGFDDFVRLEWETASEIDTAGFHLWRSKTRDGGYERITDGLIPAEGGPTMGATYFYEDTQVTPPQAWYYKLEEIESNGSRTYYGPVTVNNTTGSCPDCSGDPCVIQAIFETDKTYDCGYDQPVLLGPGVTVQKGAKVTVHAPEIKLQPGFRVESGSVVNLKQNP